MSQHVLKYAAGVAALSALAPAAFAQSLDFEARLSGAQEVVFDAEGNFVPGGVETQGSGDATAEFDDALSRVTVSLSVGDLTGNFAAAHFQCARPGENGPVAFGLVMPGPLSFDGESVSGELTNADYAGSDCAPVVGRPVNNIAALALAMADGLVYVNVHTDFAQDGEIRGQMLAGEDEDEDDADDVGDDDQP